MAKMSLRTFCYSHLKVDRVAINIYFCRKNLWEHVTIVVIQVPYSIIIFLNTLIKLLLVVNITLFHIEQHLKTFCWINGITNPLHITQIVFLSLFEFQINANMLIVNIPNRISKDYSITITILIVFLNKFLLVFAPTLRSKLLWLQERRKFSCLMSLGKSTFAEQTTFNFYFRKSTITFNNDVANLHLLLFVNINIKDYLILSSYIISLTDLDISVLETLIIKILLCKNLCTVYNVRC